MRHDSYIKDMTPVSPKMEGVETALARARDRSVSMVARLEVCVGSIVVAVWLEVCAGRHARSTLCTDRSMIVLKTWLSFRFCGETLPMHCTRVWPHTWHPGILYH